MKKPVAHLLILSLFMLLTTGLAQAMDADELVAKNLEAVGGLDKLHAVKSSIAKGKVLAQGMELPFEMKQMRPNLMRLDVTVMGMAMVQVYDGENGWSINPMSGSQDPQPMSDLENKSFKLQANLDGLLAEYKDRGFTVKYVGEADVQGTPAYQLALDTHDGIVLDLYLDKDYFLVIKQTTTITEDEKEIASDTFMSDFQEVDGLIMPFSIETKMGENTVNQIVLESVDLNAEIDPSIFVKPEAAAAAPAGK